MKSDFQQTSVMNNKRLALLLLSGFLLIGGLSVTAQNQSANATKDYASYPYWINMMQDPHGNFFEIRKAFNTYWDGREVTKGSGYKPFRRWEYYWQFRINPDGTFPKPGKVYREYNKYVQSHPTAGGLKTGQAVWKELGPRIRIDAGVGRLNAIACHPSDTSIVYAGSPSGGLWKSTDGGQNWMVLSDQLPSLGVSSILIHPSKPDDILVGTGDRDHGDAAGLGVIHSTDGGTTWEMYNSGMGNLTVGMMARSETNPDFILAATDGGIFKTGDGGAHWVLKYSVSNSSFKDLKFKPGNSNVAYATSTGAVGFYRSEDAGETWTKVLSTAGIPSADRMVIGVTQGASNLVYLVCDKGKYAGCVLSQDDGKNFVMQSSSPNIFGWAGDGSDSGSQAWYDMSLFVDPINTQQVYVGGINLWRSDDGGKTWRIIMNSTGTGGSNVHVDQHTFFYNPVNKRLYAGNDGGIYFTDNHGTAWKEISAGLGIGQIYKLGVSNTDPVKTLSGFQDNGSATWTGTNWLNVTGGDGMECAVDPRDARYSYSTSQNGPIYRMLDNSYNRTLAAKNYNGVTEDGAWVTPFLVSESDPNIMVAGYKNIWICKDVKSTGTITWTKISNNLASRSDLNFSTLENSPADGNLLFAVRWDDQRLFRTDNLLSSAVVWTDMSSSLPVNASPTDLECNPYDVNIIYMTLSNKVYKSVNKGGSWVNITGSLPNISLNTIVYDKTSTEGLYVGTDAGIYYKDADMEDWVKYGTGLPVSVGVSELEIYHDSRHRADSRLRASTFGRGVWEIPLAETSPVLPPALLTATVSGTDIDLNWIPPFYEQNILGYRVYRNGVFLIMVNSSGYTDMRVEADVTFTYKVTALYTGDNESAFTNEAFATIVSPIELPYTQTFERGTAGWSAKFSLEGWRYGTAETLAVTGREGHFFAANSMAAGEGVQVKDYLVTPVIDLSGFTGKTVTLKFAYTMRKYRSYDKFSAVYRVSPDSVWIKLADLKPPSNVAWVWDTTQVNLPEKAYTTKAQIGFYYDNSNQFAWGAAVDDVELFVNTTAVHTIDNSISLKVFPNPSQGRFNVELASGVTGEIKIQIVNIAGQVVLDKVFENNSGTLIENIDLSNQPKGIYQLTIRSKSAEWKRKITIQ